MSRRVRVLIEGEVQGVYFRDSATRRARKYEVGGWIRNLPDGRVEVIYEGEDDAVQAMIDWSWDGPDRAEVVNVQAIEEAPQGEEGFQILFES